MQIIITNLRSNRLSLDIPFEAGAGPQARVLRASLATGASVDAAASPASATLEEVNGNSQIQSLVANGSISVRVVEQTTDTMSPASQFNKLRNDVVQSLVAAVEGGATSATVPYHKCNPASITAESNADAAALPAVITLANSLKAKLNAHLVSSGDVGAHRAASAATVTAADATDQATANTLLTQEKARYNTHLAEANVHIVNDTTNSVGTADATDLPTSIALANAIKAKYNLHIAAAKCLDSLPMGTT